MKKTILFALFVVGTIMVLPASVNADTTITIQIPDSVLSVTPNAGLSPSPLGSKSWQLALRAGTIVALKVIATFAES
jgi:hypothetical protein